MLNFIVLGLVPGTNLQIDFTTLLRLVLGICLSYSLFRIFRRHFLVTGGRNLTRDQVTLHPNQSA